MCAAVFGISPRGKRIFPPANVSGAKSAGVHAPSLKSQVSLWLGAPVRKMKIALLAVLRNATLGAAVAPNSSRGLTTSAKYEATSPVPATLRKRRREKPGPSGSPPPRAHVSHSGSLFFAISSPHVPVEVSVEEKLELVHQRELQVFSALIEIAADQVID